MKIDKSRRMVKKVFIAVFVVLMAAWITSCVSEDIRVNNEFYQLKVQKAYEYETLYGSSYYHNHIDKVELFRDGKVYYVRYTDFGQDKCEPILEESERAVIDAFIKCHYDEP